MKLVTQTAELEKRFGAKKALTMISEAGFDGYDYTLCQIYNDDCRFNDDNYMEYAKELKEHADSLGLVCTQAHAPFPPSAEEPRFSRIVRSMEIAAYLGAEIIVVHPFIEQPYFEAKEALFERNMEFYCSLIPYAKQYGIKIAVENMYGWNRELHLNLDNVCSHYDEFIQYIDALDSEYITACVDIGHCVLVSENPENMIRKLSHRVGAIHAHDNSGLEDGHNIPYSGCVDWNNVCKALKDINYQGDFTFEADRFFRPSMDDDFIPIALKYLEQVGRSLIKKIDKA